MTQLPPWKTTVLPFCTFSISGSVMDVHNHVLFSSWFFFQKLTSSPSFSTILFLMLTAVPSSINDFRCYPITTTICSATWLEKTNQDYAFADPIPLTPATFRSEHCQAVRTCTSFDCGLVIGGRHANYFRFENRTGDRCYSHLSSDYITKDCCEMLSRCLFLSTRPCVHLFDSGGGGGKNWPESREF